MQTSQVKITDNNFIHTHSSVTSSFQK